MKLDLTTLSLPEPLTETRSFTDPKQPPDKPLVLTFCVTPDFSEILRSNEIANKYIRERTGPGKVPVNVGGRMVFPTTELCKIIAQIQVLEVPTMGEDGQQERYSFDEWVGISRLMPTAMGEVVIWMQEIRSRAHGTDEEVEVPNDYAADADTSSVPPQNTTLPATPTSSTTKYDLPITPTAQSGD
jgi:hypothetical protein